MKLNKDSSMDRIKALKKKYRDEQEKYMSRRRKEILERLRKQDDDK